MRQSLCLARTPYGLRVSPDGQRFCLTEFGRPLAPSRYGDMDAITALRVYRMFRDKSWEAYGFLAMQ